MKETFVKYLKTLPVIPKKNKKGFIRIVLAPRAIYWSFPKIERKEISEAIKWLKGNKLEIPYSDGVLKELVK